jgi:hypothetical protein
MPWSDEQRDARSNKRENEMDSEIPSAETGKMKIYNPVTGKYYRVCQCSGKYKEPGQIKGPWSPKKKNT